MTNLIKNFLDNNKEKNANRSIELNYMIYGATVTFFLIFTLSIYHFIAAEMTIGMADLLISLIFLFIAVKLDQPKQIKHLNVFLAVLFLACLSTAIFIKGSIAFYWTFPVISATYFMTSKHTAFILTIIGISLTYIIAFNQVTHAHYIEYYPALLLHSIFQYIWASRTSSQQERLYELATKDALTKINNRLSFNERIDSIIKRISRNKTPVSLLMLDLDHFKTINDTYGHNVGDDVLRNFTVLISKNIRKSDAFYRYGGEEFIIIADNTTTKNAAVLAEQLRKQVDKDLFLKKFELTVSIGVTTLLHEDDRSSVLNRVDNALYSAKESGRNCIHTITRSVSSSYSYQ